MNINFLHVANLRCFERAEFVPGRRINWLVGANGAGKTTLLEAAFLLSHGRSFRRGNRDAPRRHGATEYLVHAEVARSRGTNHKIGIARQSDGWQARLDGYELSTLAPLFAACPVVCFGPDSPSLMLGAADERRSFLDWSVFHVEHESLSLWRRWRRALRQRNTLLREGGSNGDLEPWERELDRLGEHINKARKECLASLEPYFSEETSRLIPELGRAQVRFRAGWNETLGLGAHLAESRATDRARGFTQLGAHRADWMLQFERVVKREHLSRGQAKAAAMACLLAQTRWLNDRIGEYPLLCLDDLHSELDHSHVSRVIAWLADKPIQAWLTATETPKPANVFVGSEVFHVEHQGVVPHVGA